MSLTHVYAILNGKTKSVVVEEVEKLRFRPHLFCKLCGEDVSFVEASRWRSSFFRHSPNPDKTCMEKSDRTGNGSVPLRQRSLNSEFFVRLDPQLLHGSNPSVEVEIALPPIDDSMHKELVLTEARFEVRADNQVISVYRADRLSSTGRSYIPIGRCFASRYDLSVRRGRSILYSSSRFNTLIDGFDGDGMLFSMETGRRIPFQAEVYVGISYAWVGKDYNAPKLISDVESVCMERWSDGWCAYRVKASCLSDSAVRAFIRFGTALCERGDVVYPLWPCFIRKNEQVYIEPNERRFYGVKAETVSRGIPEVVEDEGEFRSVSFGYLCYPIPLMYFEDGEVSRDVEIWKESFQGTALEPLVEIWDPDCRDGDKHVPFGVLDKLPLRRRLKIKARCEGRVESRFHGRRRQRFALKAQDVVSIDVRRGMSLTVYQGLDLVGKIVFKKLEQQQADCEESLTPTERRWLLYTVEEAEDGAAFRHLLSRTVDGTELHSRLQKFVQGNKKVSPQAIAVFRKRLNKKG